MKSVCILLQHFYDMDIRVRRKAEALVAAGYHVDVLALRSAYSNSKSKSYTLNGVNVYTFGLSKRRGSRGRYLFEYVAFLFWAFFKVFLLTERRAYAVIDVNTLPDFLVFAACYAKWKGAKVLLDMHEITPEFVMSKYGISRNHWQVRLAELLEHASMRYANHVITINHPIQQLLENRGLPPGKSTVIMNSADERLFAPVSDASHPSEITGDRANFVMMYHGTLTRIYGLDIALEAFAKVHQEMPGAQYWILGNGPEKDPLEKLAHTLGLDSKVRFIGTVLPQEVPAWLKRCDIGVLPTRRDIFLDLSFSNKLSEYIIMGKAVIASSLKGIRYYFSEDALAFFHPKDPADLAKQMLRLYRDDELRLRLAERAKHEYAPISWKVMKQRYLTLMEHLTGTYCGAAVESPSAVASVLSK